MKKILCLSLAALMLTAFLPISLQADGYPSPQCTSSGCPKP